MITNAQSGTNVQEIAPGIYRMNTPQDIPGVSFSFNQYLLQQHAPRLFHTGPRPMVPLVRDAVNPVLPAARRPWSAFSQDSAAECGPLNARLATPPAAPPLCSATAAMVSIAAAASREPRGLTDGETFSTGRRTLRWLDTPPL